MRSREDWEFEQPRVIPVGDLQYSLDAGDLDGDGDLDLTAGNFSAGVLYILRNRGHGNFKSHVSFNREVGAGFLRLVDIDGDGDMDILSGNRDNPSVFIFVNDGLGDFLRIKVVPYRASGILSVDDLDGDGFLDLALSDRNSEKLAFLLRTFEGVDRDCDHNGTLDGCEIAMEKAENCNRNGIPDVCETVTALDFIAPASLGLGTWPTAIEPLTSTTTEIWISPSPATRRTA